MNEYLEQDSHLPFKRLMSQAVPAAVAMLLTSGIVIVDGIFIGRSLGKVGLACVNLSFPLFYLFLALAVTAGVGGAVNTSHALGAGDKSRADHWFSFTLILTLVLTSGLAAVCLLGFNRLLGLLNSRPELAPGLSDYLGILIWFYPSMMVNLVLTIFLRAQGRPGLALAFGLAGNLVNIVLDWAMIPRWGLTGAALASGISQLLPLGISLVWFGSGRSRIRFRWVSLEFSKILKVLYNGVSEMITQLSVGMTTWIFNRVLLARMGVDGVAAYTIIGYMAFIQMMLVTGLAVGMAPIVGYDHGAGRPKRGAGVTRVALGAGAVSGLVCWLLVLLLAVPIAGVFSRGNAAVVQAVGSGGVLFAAAFLFNGFNILITAHFTAIGHAGTSAVIALLRGIVLVNLLVLVLPLVWGNPGIWAAYPLAEVITLGVSFGYYRRWMRGLSL